MAISIRKSQSSYQLPDRAGESTEYTVWVRGSWIKLHWGEMTRFQKQQQIESERREAYDALFDPCGILF